MREKIRFARIYLRLEELRKDRGVTHFGSIGLVVGLSVSSVCYKISGYFHRNIQSKYRADLKMTNNEATIPRAIIARAYLPSSRRFAISNREKRVLRLFR